MTVVEEFAALLRGLLSEGRLLACTLSKLRSKETPYEKVSLRPIELRGELVYQVTYHYGQKELHENLTSVQVEELILDLMDSVFRQGYFFTPEADWQILVSKKGTMKILQHGPSRKGQDISLTHNRTKQYILREGTAYPFLIELGVMNQAGKVLKKHYHKFRQLNKYLEVVEDCIPYLENKGDRPLRIVDFGSGKAYLTFALYHYLVEHLNYDVQMIGLDLKEDVVAFCNAMTAKLGYEHLQFYAEDIRGFQAEGPVDVVVSLHACDVATDYALDQAVRWGAQVILAVPCCQHEVLGQLDQDNDPVLLEHGILKERVAALLTDAARGKLLETQGYAVRVMEFIDLEHTPKNLLIRAFLDPKAKRSQARDDYLRFTESWGIKPTLESLLTKES